MRGVGPVGPSTQTLYRPLPRPGKPGHSAHSLLRTTLGDTQMAKTQKNRNALSTPPTLATLLSVPSPPIQPSTINPLDDPVIVNQLNHGNYYDDRRRHHPAPHFKPPHGLIRGATRLVIGKAPTTVRFAVPDLVGICVRRKARREVMHALKRINRGKGGGKRRRNRYSNVQC